MPCTARPCSVARSPVRNTWSQLAARYEKAVDFDGAGSITILAVTTMPGDDVTHPVPDNTGYITEGHFYFRIIVLGPYACGNKHTSPCRGDYASRF